MSNPRTPRPYAQEYITLVTRAYADRAGEPTPPDAKVNVATLFKLRLGVKVQVWFTRYTPTKIPELRVGIVFDAYRREINAAVGDAFFAHHAPDLAALGGEYWPSESNNDRRYMTPLPCPAGVDLNAVAARAATLAARYVELLKHASFQSH